MTVHNVTAWDVDQLAPYMTDILVTLGKLGKRFPKDCNTSGLFRQYLAGEKALWIVLDGEKLDLVAMSHVRSIPHTGAKIATLCDIAGRHVRKHIADMYVAFEAWADEQGPGTIKQVEGRPGWERLLKPYGYETHSVLLRKSQ